MNGPGHSVSDKLKIPPGKGERAIGSGGMSRSGSAVLAVSETSPREPKRFPPPSKVESFPAKLRLPFGTEGLRPRLLTPDAEGRALSN